MYPSRLDDKGRAKLPVTFQRYFQLLREKTLFVTSLDRRTALVYTMDGWRQVEKFFDTYKEDPELTEKAAFNAVDLGAETEMDAQGRILFPPELRRELGLENAPVRVWAHRGRLVVLSEAAYEERRHNSEITPVEMRKLESVGPV